MSLITAGTFFISMGTLCIGGAVIKDMTWPLVAGLVLIFVGIMIQLYGEAKVENRLADMREEYIDLFNHSDEWSTSYDHPEIVKPEDIQGSESIEHMSSCKHIDRIDTLNLILNGKENN